MTPADRNIILIVDDEPIILRMATAALASAGFRVQVAENGLAGLECFLSAADEICLVLADIVMPIMGGVEMAEKIVHYRPDVGILLITGYTSRVVGEDTAYRFPVIHKPFLAEDLIRKVQGLLQTGAGAD